MSRRDSRRGGPGVGPALNQPNAAHRLPHQLVYLCLQATIEGQASHAHVHEIIAGLQRRGWHVRLYQPAYASGRHAPKALARLVEFFRVQVRLLPSLRSADVVYIRWHFATLPGALAAWLLGKRVVQEVNGNYEDVYAAWPSMRRFQWLLKFLQRLQLRMASGIVAVTPQLASWVLQEAGNSRVTVIPNAANEVLFHPGASTNIELPRPYVAFVGAFAPWQGIVSVLSAVDHPDWPADVHLVLVGDGQMAPLVRRAAAENERIRYLGRLPYGRIPGILSSAMAALCTSNSRTAQSSRGQESPSGVHPLKLYEAMACGTAVICSDQPGQADLIRSNGAGVVVAPERPGELAKAVAWLSLNPEDRARMGARGRRAVETAHTWDLRASDTDRFIRSLATVGRTA